MTDDDRRALNAIRRIITATQHADTSVLAAEILTVLRGQGWRPTPARPAQAWQPPAGPGAPPGDDWRQARAAMRGQP